MNCNILITRLNLNLCKEVYYKMGTHQFSAIIYVVMTIKDEN